MILEAASLRALDLLKQEQLQLADASFREKLVPPSRSSAGLMRWGFEMDGRT